MDIQFYWGIITGAFIVLVTFLIPLILQIKRTAKAAEDFLQITQASLNPLLRKLQEAAEKTIQVTDKLDESISNVQHLTEAVGETGAIINHINTLITQISSFISGRTSSFGAGIRTALSVFAQGIVKKEVEK